MRYAIFPPFAQENTDLTQERCLRGAPVAQTVLHTCAHAYAHYKTLGGGSIALAVINIGHDPASAVYISHKEKQAKAMGFSFISYALEANASPQEVLTCIHKACQQCQGVILQLPVPTCHEAHVQTYLAAISAVKDVDGLNPMGSAFHVPCTALGCLMMLRYYGIPLAGQEVVVLGRSYLVGRPLANLLVSADATLTLAHSKSQNLSAITRRAHILIVATGRMHLITARDVSERTWVLDVGIHRKDGTLTGDVHPDVLGKVRGCSPVPGGVGPTTVACLMWNVLVAGFLEKGWALALEAFLRDLTPESHNQEAQEMP